MSKSNFDVKKLVLGEVAKVEDLSGQSVTVLGKDEAPKGLLLAALAFVWHRRSHPEFTWNDALGLTMDEANNILGFGDDDEDAAEDLVTFQGQEIGAKGDSAGDPFPQPEPSAN